MRLLHLKTLQIAANRDDIPRTVISHVWSEIFKWKASGKSHPKMFIYDEYTLGEYMALVYKCGIIKNCNLDKDKIKKLSKQIQIGFLFSMNINSLVAGNILNIYFDDNYLFSDACSLYYKGINIFPDIFGDQWRKYVPVESHKEIKRQIDKLI